MNLFLTQIWNTPWLVISNLLGYQEENVYNIKNDC